jgi:hypothetical protein
MIQLGGESAWRVRRSGPMVMAYHWYDGKPAMFVYPVSRPTAAGALCVPLESAHLWAKSNGYPDLEHAIPTAIKAAQTMQLTGTKDDIRAIVDAVLSGIEDLLRMPPERPKPKGEVVGELSIKSGGTVTTEREITAEELA